MHAPAATRVSCHTCTLCRKSAMASAWSCQHAEGLAIVRSLGPVGFYRWWPDGGAGYAAWLLPGGATQGRPAHPHASPWHGQAPHALTQWNAPASLVSPPAPTLTCPRSSLWCAGPWPPWDRARPVGCTVLAGSHPPCRITRYSHCWWLAGRCRMCWLVGYLRPDFGLVWVGRGVVAVPSVLHSPGVAGP